MWARQQPKVKTQQASSGAQNCRHRYALWAGLAAVALATTAHPSAARAHEQDFISEDDRLTVPELLVPRPGQDLSAYRYDAEVFGWNRAFTEVGALGTEVTRGPRGKHRGEAFMLVYPVGDTLPLHNINCHVITHADSPDDPVPLDDARDMLWALENPIWLATWPKRPLRHRPKGAMQVEPLWDPMDPNSEVHTPSAAPSGAQPAPGRRDSALCAPGVAFVLTYRGQRRVQPHTVVDLKARCDLLRMTDNRIYWGDADVAADMVRFDFSPKPDNEQSARFIVSAAWRLGEAITFEVSAHSRLSPAQHQHISAATQHFGPVHVAVPSSRKVAAAGQQVLVAVTAAPRFVTLARHVAAALGAEDVAVTADPASSTQVTLHFSDQPAQPTGAGVAAASPTAAGPAAASPVAASGHSAEALTDPNRGLKPSPKSSSRSPSYIDDWKVP